MKMPERQTDVTTLKQFWMRVSFRDAVKLGAGFALGASIATFLIGFAWFLIRMALFGTWILSNAPTSIPL